MSKVQNFVHLIKIYDGTMTDKMIIEKVVKTLTSRFYHVIVIIQESSDLSTMKLEKLVGSLEARELRIIERRGVQESIQALQAQTWKKHSGSRKFN